MIRVAIIGTGAIADSHIEAYLQFPERCMIVALVDLYPDKAAQKAARYGLDVPIFTNHTDLLNGPAFDLASICTPPFEHAPAAVDLLAAGRHVLVEKPLATSLEECDAMLAAAHQGNALLSVVAQNRFRTPLMRLKTLLAESAAGRILHAQVESFWWRGSHYYDLWWRGLWEKEGGGCTLNHAVHQIDLFHWMRGMPAAVQAFTANVNHENSEVEDFSTALLFYPDGSLGQISASLLHHGEEQRMVFQGERALLAFPWRIAAYRQLENGFPEGDEALLAELQARYDALPEVQPGLHAGQILNVLQAITGEAELLVSGEDGRRTIELVSAIYQSGATGQRVSLPMTPADPFYTRQGVLAAAPRFHQKTTSVENFSNNTITVGAVSDQKKS